MKQPGPHVVQTRSLRQTRTGFKPIILAVHVCTYDPHLAVFRQGLSAQFTHFDGREFTVPHYSFSARGITIANHVYLTNERLPAAGTVSLAGFLARAAGYEPAQLDETMVMYPHAYKMHSTIGGDCERAVLSRFGWGRLGFSSRRPILWRLWGPNSATAGTGHFFVKQVDVPLTGMCLVNFMQSSNSFKVMSGFGMETGRWSSGNLAWVYRYYVGKCI